MAWFLSDTVNKCTCFGGEAEILDCPQICSNCSRILGLVGGGLAGLVFWSRAHFSQGFEAVDGCFLDGTSEKT